MPINQILRASVFTYDWHCQYHIVWVPKYRYKVLKGKVGEEVPKTVAGLGADYQSVCDYVS
ncbi:MAG: transposase [Methylococcaceae bacterium]